METNYDKELNKVDPPLFMLPYIGPNYASKSLLFIGESDYNDGTTFNADWKRNWILEERINQIKTDSRLLNNIDKTILADNKNETTQKELWSSVAFTNLVQRPMDWLENKKDTPSEQDLVDGWNTMLKVILILKPKTIIKWGILGHGTLCGQIHKEIYQGWSLERLEDNFRFLKLNHISGFSTQILFMQHPSFPYYSPTQSKERIDKYLTL